MEKEIDLKELFGIIWQNIIKIILATLVCAALAFLITYFWVTPMYTASVSMYVTNNENRSDTAITNGDLTASQGLVDTYIVVLESDTLLSKTAEALPYSYSTEELRRMISAEAINNTEAFRINVENADPAVAQTIANAVAKVAPDEIKRVVKAGSVEVIDYAKLPVKADWPVARNTAKRVLLIDCDMRKPKVHTLMDIEETPGLSEYLAGIETELKVHESRHTDKFFIVSAGAVPPNPTELLSSSSMKKLLESESENYDYILLDTPPVNMVADSLVLKSLIDGYILVVRANKTNQNDLDQAMARLEQVDAHCLGFILNDVNPKSGGYGRYGKYGHYGHYGHGYDYDYGYAGSGTKDKK
jgi:capsular exopolysaccharide synthesis family protein